MTLLQNGWRKVGNSTCKMNQWLLSFLYKQIMPWNSFAQLSTLLNTALALCPPNPKVLLSAMFTCLCILVPNTKFNPVGSSGSMVCVLIVGGMVFVSMALIQIIASAAPAAPSKCPVADFVAL